MDSWTDYQLRCMYLGGNDQWNQHCGNGDIQCLPGDRAFIQKKYDNDDSQLYKLQLQARAKGQPVPTSLPQRKNKNDMSGGGNKSKYQGFGSSPPPPSSRGSGGNRVLWRSATATTVVAIVATVAYTLLAQGANAMALTDGQITTFYGRVGKVLDLMSVVEDKPRNRALAELEWHDDLGKKDTNDECKPLHVLEVGVGTGRTARQILQQHPNVQRYTGYDVTPKMVHLAREALKEFSNDGSGTAPTTTGVITELVQGNALEQEWSTADIVVAFYVLDIWSDDQIKVFLQKAKNEAKCSQLCLVTLAQAPQGSILAGLVMGLWNTLLRVSPMLVGGCKPTQMQRYLEESNDWTVRYCQVQSVLGYTSEIVVAVPK